MPDIKNLKVLLANLTEKKTKIERGILDIENAIEIEEQKVETNKIISDNILQIKSHILSLVPSRRRTAEIREVPCITSYIHYLPRLCGKTTAIVEASVDLKIAHPNIPVVIVTNSRDKNYELDMTDRITNYCVNKYGFSLTKENIVKLIRTVVELNVASITQRAALTREVINKLRNTGAIIIFDLYNYNVGDVGDLVWGLPSLIKSNREVTLSDKFENELASVAILITNI